MTKGQLRTIVNARLTEMDTALANLTDETAINVIILFPEWQPNHQYDLNYRLRYKNKLYKVVQAHTSQIEWEPNLTPALFTEVAKPNEIPVWKQPTGVQDAYMNGDQVYYPTSNDDIWQSDIDNNVWQPGVYGWIKI